MGDATLAEGIFRGGFSGSTGKGCPWLRGPFAKWSAAFALTFSLAGTYSPFLTFTDEAAEAFTISTEPLRSVLGGQSDTQRDLHRKGAPAGLAGIGPVGSGSHIKLMPGERKLKN